MIQKWDHLFPKNSKNVFRIYRKRGRRRCRGVNRWNIPCEQGYFVEPTIFADVDDKMTIAKEEIFGPVIAALPYEDFDEVIERANDSNYGLSSRRLDTGCYKCSLYC